MPILRNEKLILALNVEPNVKEAALTPVLDALRDTNNPSKLVQSITEDTELTDTLMLYARSSYFKHATPPTTLTQAEEAIGHDTLGKLALVAIASDMLSESFEPYSFDTGLFLDFSLMTANMMESLAIKTGSPPLLSYAIGLFHGFGRYLFNQYLKTIDPEGKHRAPAMDYPSYSRWERANIGMSHANAASVLLVKWGLPEVFYRPIQFQNRPEEAGKLNVKLAAHLNICLMIAAHECIPEQNPSAIQDIPTHYYELAGIHWQLLYSLPGPAFMNVMRIHHILLGMKEPPRSV